MQKGPDASTMVLVRCAGLWSADYPLSSYPELEAAFKALLADVVGSRSSVVGSR